GSKQVLNDVNLDINEGEIFGVIGASGAGKTTLLESMIDFIPLNKGEIAYRTNGTTDNFATLKKMPDFKKEIGFSTQDPSFYDRLTVKENLEYFATLYDIPQQFIPQRIKTILDLVELTGEENTLGGELSGGMQKRLDIACSIINDPKVLILDEPTADLDPLLRKHIWALLRKINSTGKTIIISSHFLEEMDVLCNRIGLIHEKSIVHVGTTEEFRQQYPYTQEIILDLASKNYQPLADQLRGLPVNKVTQRGGKMVIYTKQADIILRTLMKILEKSRETILELEVQKPTLDEVFTLFIEKKEAV
ncbi:MAG TPA: ABC transporter ATP-binding protein, partial [Candidatus Nanoarchaeia archaeon]|nr:ABC transporter ATP-binding protein [Candidatus Nanoarchaeia archaeon]